MVDEQKLSWVLRDFARTVATDFPVQGVLDHLVDKIAEILPVSSAGVSLIREGEAPHLMAASSPSALAFERLQSELAEGPCMLAFSSGEAVTVPYLHSEQRFPRFTSQALDLGMAAVFTFPLCSGPDTLGALDVYREQAGPLSARDLDAAQTLADVAGAYLVSARTRDAAAAASQAFRHSALHDPLTGLANRVLLAERLEHAAERAARTPSNVAVLFADLDEFKSVNDTLGHEAGDAVLVEVADRLRAVLRPGDTLARLGGDEFVILVEDLEDPDNARALAERVVDVFVEPFALGGTPMVIAASVGIAYAGTATGDLDGLLGAADAAMYEAKAAGGGGAHLVDLRAGPQRCR